MSVKSKYKLQVIKLDLKVKQIYDLQKSVPSEYAQGKAVLQNVRALVAGNDLKKAVTLTEKALRLFQEESVLAGEYNRVVGSLTYSNNTVLALQNDYLRELAAGNYGAAKEVLGRLANIRPVIFPRHQKGPEAVVVDGSDGGALVKINNPNGYAVFVNNIVLHRGTTPLKCREYPPFTVGPRSTFTVEFQPATGDGPLNGNVNIDDAGCQKSIELR